MTQDPIHSNSQVPLTKVLSGNAFVRPDGSPFWQFLDTHNVDYNKNDFHFLTAHKIPRIKEVFNFREYMQLKSRGQAISYLYQGLGRALDYVGPVLDLELKHGFNDHTDRHTLWVSQTGVELLQRAGMAYNGGESYDEITEVMMTLVGMTHDLGNFLSRKEHSTYSAWMLTRMFTNWKNEPERYALFKDALYAILFHEEPVLVEHNLSLQQGTPLQWALVCADKMHVGRDRIGSRSFESGVLNGALEDDFHILLEALIVRSSWHLGVDRFVWDLDFSVEQLEDKFKTFTKGNKRLWIPKFMQVGFLKKGMMYRDTFIELFTEIYINRLNMAAEAAFLLFPFVNKFEVKLTDNDVRGKVGSAQMLVWEKKR